MSIVPPNPTQGKAMLLGQTAWPTVDDVADNKVSGLYSHLATEYSATMAQMMVDAILASGSMLSDQIAPVYNNTGSPLLAGTLVYKTGWNSANAAFTIAKADNSDPVKQAKWVLTDVLPDVTAGLAYRLATLTNVDTSGASAVGDKVYLDSATPGAFVFVKPASPARWQEVGTVSVKDAFVGAVRFDIQPLASPVGGAIPAGLLFFGETGGVCTAGAMSGDATFGSTGAISLIDVATAGTIVYPASITYDAKGRMITATAGTAPLITVAGSLLAANAIWFGNGSNVATSGAVSGDLTMTAGAFTLNSVATAGTYLNLASIILDSKGRVTTALSRSVTAKTADDSLTSAMNGKVFNNAGTTALVTLTLPAASVDLEYHFTCMDTDGLKILAVGTDTIRRVGTVSAAAGYIKSTVIGSAVLLRCESAGQWVVVSELGTWTTDS